MHLWQYNGVDFTTLGVVAPKFDAPSSPGPDRQVDYTPRVGADPLPGGVPSLPEDAALSVVPMLPVVPAPRRPILTGILLFILCMLLLVAISMIGWAYVPLSPSAYRVLTVAGQILCWLLPAVAVAKLQWGRVLAGLRIAPVRPSAVLAASFGGLCVGALSSFYLIAQQVYLVPESMMADYLAQRARVMSVYARMMSAADPLAIAAVVAVVAIVPGICEESAFRGAIQRGFEWRLRPWQAILLASLLFGLAHLQPVNIVPLTMIGAFFGYVAWRTGSIIPTMVAHALFNGMMFLMVRLYPRAAGEHRYTQAEFLGVLPAAVFLLGLLLLIIAWFNRAYGADRRIALEQ